MRALLALCFWTLAISAAPSDLELASEEALALRRIVDFWEEGEYQIAKNQMEDFLAEFSENPYSDTLRAALGDLFLREKSYQTALSYYAQINTPSLRDKALSNRMQCLYHLQWHATLADECEAYLQRAPKTTSEKGRLEATYFLAIALYQQCLNPAKDEAAIQSIAERAKPYFESLCDSELSDEVAGAFAHLRCILKDFEGASKIYLDLSKKKNPSEELLFQAALIQSKYDKEISAQTFEEITKQAGPFAKEAAYNQLILSFDLGHHQQIADRKEAILESIPEERRGLAHLFIGQSFLSLGQYREAAIELHAFLDANTSAASIRPALLHLLEASYRAGDLSLLDEAMTRLKQFNPIDEGLPKALFSRVQLLKKAQKLEEAKGEIRSLLAQFPDFSDRPLASFEIAHLESATGQWIACREAAQIFLQEYPSHELSPFAWRYFICSSIELANQAKEFKQECADDLAHFLQEADFLSISERLDFQFHLAKIHFERGAFESCANLLETLLKEEVEFDQSANAELLFALTICQRAARLSSDPLPLSQAIDLSVGEKEFFAPHQSTESPSFKEGDLQNYELFCTWAERALSHQADLLPQADQHLALFNAYLSRGGEYTQRAAEHLYAAFQCKAVIQLPNLLWLADYTYAQYERDLSWADKAFDILSFLIEEKETKPIDRETLYLEPLILKSAKLHAHFGRKAESIDCLQRLKAQYSSSPQLAWSCEKQVKLFLAESILQNGEQAAAEILFEELASSPVLKDRFAASAALQSVRLKRLSPEPDFALILSRLKNLILQKNLENEPIHLEAALDYIDLQTQLESPEKKAAKQLFLLTKTKADFEQEEDLFSKDYHAARSHLQTQNQIYLAYMGYLNAQILLAQSELETNCEQQKELQTKAKEILLQIATQAPPLLRARLNVSAPSKELESNERK